MLSMTGYGRGECSRDGNHVLVRLSSVNRKGADIRVRVPTSLDYLEPELRRRVRECVSRGAVSLTVEISPSGAAAPRLNINRDLVKALLTEASALQNECGLQGQVALSDLLAVPDLVSVGEAELPREQFAALVGEALDNALAELHAARAREGTALRADLMARRQRLLEILAEIRARSPELQSRYRERLRDRVQRLSEDLALDEERLEREVIVYADRADITEELIRLHSHLEHLGRLFDTDGPVGRKLDFLMQEHMREINTVGSKAPDEILSRHVVEFKTELERIREQVQNIE